MALIITRLSKGATVVRNNWKKSVFFSCAGLWLSSLWIERNRINCLMREYCEEANKIGGQFLKPTAQPHHVTVILNPAAKKRKSKKDYESYVEPILHCAGFKVSLVLTESEGQERDLMNIMHNTDSVVIAGGSGSMHDAITGMLRRTDGVEYPLGFIPLGVRNTVSQVVHGGSNLTRKYYSKSYSDAKQIADATLAVVKDIKREIDVLKVESLDRNKVVYSISGLTFGTLPDIISKCEKYWYLGNRAKPYLAIISKTLFRPFDHFTLKEMASIEHSSPCSGCRDCSLRSKVQKQPLELTAESLGQSKRWWSAFTPKAKKPVESENPGTKKTVDFSSIVNEECGKLNKQLPWDNIVNLTLANDPTSHQSELIIHRSDNLNKGQFVLDGVALRKGNMHFADAQLTRVPVQDVQIHLNSNQQQTDRLLEIDGEKYELENIHVSRLPRRLSVFTLNNK